MERNKYIYKKLLCLTLVKDNGKLKKFLLTAPLAACGCTDIICRNIEEDLM